MTFYWEVKKLFYDQEFNHKGCGALHECVVLCIKYYQYYLKKFMLKSYQYIPDIFSNNTSTMFRTQA